MKYRIVREQPDSAYIVVFERGLTLEEAQRKLEASVEGLIYTDPNSSGFRVEEDSDVPTFTQEVYIKPIHNNNNTTTGQ
jgi:hypothetical protein